MISEKIKERVRKEILAGKLNQREIAAKYGIAPSTVCSMSYKVRATESISLGTVGKVTELSKKVQKPKQVLRRRGRPANLKNQKPATKTATRRKVPSKYKETELPKISNEVRVFLREDGTVSHVESVKGVTVRMYTETK